MSATTIINAGVGDLPIIKSIDEECIGNALRVFNDIRSALIQLSQTTDSQKTEVEFLELESKTTMMLVDLFSTRLTTADKACTHIPFFAKEYPSHEAFHVSEQLLSAFNETAAGLNIHSSLALHAPASKGLLIRSPVVGLTITLPNSILPIKVSRLAVGGINISLPLKAMQDDEWTQFMHQAECMYWDSDNKGYIADGVQVMDVQRTHVVCKSSHLTDFVINQNLNLPVPLVLCQVIVARYQQRPHQHF